MRKSVSKGTIHGFSHPMRGRRIANKNREISLTRHYTSSIKFTCRGPSHSSLQSPFSCKLTDRIICDRWLKEVIGHALNRFDEGTLEREVLVAKFTSLTSDSPFCALSRYRHLRTADFTDDITTINANELMGAGGPEGMDMHEDNPGAGQQDLVA